MPPEKITRQQLEEAFRNEMSKVVELVQAFSSHCHSLEELVGVCELAGTNDAQLRILMELATQWASRQGKR